MSANVLIAEMVREWENTRDLCLRQIESIRTGKVEFAFDNIRTADDIIDRLHKVKREIDALLTGHRHA